jgi:protein SCO1/2
MFNTTATTLHLSVIAFVAALTCAVSAQLPPSAMPAEMQGIEIIERLNEPVPMDLEFINEAGETVRFGDFFEEGKPVILTLNYYTCPMLCHLTLNGLVEGLRELEWTAGEDFQIVTITINPTETPEQAAAFKRRYMQQYGRETAEDGWHFLCDKDGNVKKMAEAVGFGYRFVPETGEYAHSSSIQFITPDGRISRYMNDIMFEPRDLRFALVESSRGGIGSPMDRFLLFTCFQYDPNSNSYAPAAWKIMRAGGAVTVVVVGLGLFLLWLRGGLHDRAGRGGHTSATLAIGGNA